MDEIEWLDIEKKRAIANKIFRVLVEEKLTVAEGKEVLRFIETQTMELMTIRHS